jgi:hypothetical protein
VYSDTFLFRSSPFFWSLGSLLGNNADFFFAAHSHQTAGRGVGWRTLRLVRREQG